MNMPCARDVRVLIVDDEESVRAAFIRQLARMGFTARCARSAEEALELLRAERFDAIFIDILLPGMSGFQALQSIAAVSRASVVLMSGHAADEFREDARLLGAKDILGKPFGPEELRACLSRVLSQPG